MGRYIQSDPIGIMEDYSDPMMQIAAQMGLINSIPLGGLNHLYGYVDQNPANYFDPDGLRRATSPVNAPYSRQQRRAETLRRQQQSMKDRLNNLDRKAQDGAATAEALANAIEEL